MHNSSHLMRADRRVILVCGCFLLSILIGAVWWDAFLPMQDYPQHLYMAEVASNYDNPLYNWKEFYELRGSFGPYRAAFITQTLLGAVTGVEIAGKLIVTLYIALVGVLAYRIFSATADEDATPWGALLFFPLCFHPMYFYGFVNFTFSIPVLLLALLHLKSVVVSQSTLRATVVQGLLVLSLFLLHPYILVTYMVLAPASAIWLGRSRGAILHGTAYAVLAAVLFVGWSALDPSMSDREGGRLTLEGLQMVWWPIQTRLSFLAMIFTGLRITPEPVWWVAAVWLLVLIPLCAGLGKIRELGRNSYLFAILSLLALAGYFVLPSTLVTDYRYTFFNMRMAPIFLFLLVPFIAQLRIGRRMGQLLLVLCTVLTIYSASLHHRVSQEFESVMPLFDKMEPGANILPIVGGAPSAILDRRFYANFYAHLPFYYHVLKGGGLNPDLFGGNLMPVSFREGKRPTRPSTRKLHPWLPHKDQYDYVIARGVPRIVVNELEQHGTFVDSAGPWAVYRIND